MENTNNKIRSLYTKNLIIFLIVFFGIFGSVKNSQAVYTPPVGIPAPPFGINEVVPTTATQCLNWPSSATVNCYYIDKDYPSATDINNIYGYPNVPRVSIPTTLAAGSYVEIHNSAGGAYTGTDMTITGNGTASNPVWIRGSSSVTKPTIRRAIAIRGSYMIIENLYFDTDRKDVSINLANYISFRNNEMAGPGINSGNTAAVAVSDSSYIVIYNNRIHDWGNKNDTLENDYHGVKVSSGSNSIWVLNNEIYNNGGDSIQTAFTTGAYVYIGGNTFYGNKENAIDVKQGNHVIISENHAYGFLPSLTSAGTAITIHYLPDNVWVIRNKVHDSTNGIFTTGSVNAYFVGNLVYNIHHSGAWDPSSSYQDGTAFHSRGSTGITYVIGNTIDNADIGIQTSNDPIIIYNNIISNRAMSDGNDIHSGTLNALTDADYNLIYNSYGTARVKWGSAGTFTSINSFNSATGKCANCIQSNPLYTNPAVSVYTLSAGSPAINRAMANFVYQKFYDTYGIDIRFAIDGTPRPQDGVWDIGAYEYVGAAPPPDTTPPAAPSGVSVL
ncbi:MAG: right-handed parallel beta-helix repeat-containing protein [Patescibacteria group bacterium]